MIQDIIRTILVSMVGIIVSAYFKYLFRARGFLLYRQRIFKNSVTDIEHVLIAIWNPIEASVFWYQITKDFVNKIENPNNHHLEILEFTDRRLCDFLKEEAGKVVFKIEQKFPAKSGFIALLSYSPFLYGKINNKRIVNSDVFIKNTRIGFMIIIIAIFFLLYSFTIFDCFGVEKNLSTVDIIIRILIMMPITGCACWLGDGFIRNRFCMPKPLQDVFDGKNYDMRI